MGSNAKDHGGRRASALCWHTVLPRSQQRADALRSPVCCLTLLILACFPALAAGATSKSYGDITVLADTEPQGYSSHGYTEYRFTVTNRSATAGHVVTLQLPHNQYGGGRETHLRSVSRTVAVGPEASVRVSLFVPAFPTVIGGGLGVTIDGRRDEEGMPLNYATSSHGGGRHYGRGGYYGRSATVSSGEGQPLVLVGPTMPASFAEALSRARDFDEVKPVPPPGGGAAAASLPILQISKLDVPPAAWPTTWLAYTRYDLILLTAADLAAISAGAARTALWQYVECGGMLLVLGQAPMPETWPKPRTHLGMQVYDAGFGKAMLREAGPIGEVDWFARRAFLQQSWSESAQPFQSMLEIGQAHRMFPVVDDVGVPVRGLFVVMLSFVLVIGPINLLVLSRIKRRLWMLWTVPALSFATCAAVFVYMALAEGWSGHLRTETLTVLDESSHRAATIGWTAFYSPLTPSDGLHFSPETELSLQAAVEHNYYRGGNSGSECIADWTTDQHLARGWVSARVPAHFMVRKSEIRRERVALRRGLDGKLTIVNGLGAPIKKFWYRDEQGGVFQAEDVPVGEQIVLQNAELPAGDAILPPQPQIEPRGFKDKMPMRKPPAPAKVKDKAEIAPARVEPPREGLRALYTGQWLTAIRTLPQQPRWVLRPKTYVAELEESVFLEDGLRGTKSRKCRAVVIGVNKEPEKE